MADPITRNLPAPHDCISVSVTKWFRDEWHVRYTGTPQQLVAAGVVDDDMVRKITSQKGGARTGKDGVPFKLRSGRIPAHVQWARGEAVDFDRRPSSTEQLMKLPGMTELFPNGFPADEQDEEDDPLTLEQLVEQFPMITTGMAFVANAMASRIGASSVRNATLCDRRIGRRQRPAQWLSIGKVIAPNWAAAARTA